MLLTNAPALSWAFKPGVPEALDSEQVQSRGFVQTLEDGNQVPTLPFRLGGINHYAPSSTAPTLGEHTAEISREFEQT